MSDDGYKNYTDQDYENYKRKVDADLNIILDKILEAEITNNDVWLNNQFQLYVSTVSNLINKINNDREIMPKEQIKEMEYFISKYIEVIDLCVHVAERMGLELFIYAIEPEDLDKYR